MSFYDRAMTWKHVTKHKEHQKRVELQEQELSTCTFRPRVHPKNWKASIETIPSVRTRCPKTSSTTESMRKQGN